MTAGPCPIPPAPRCCGLRRKPWLRLAPGLPADAATLLRELHAAVPTAELAAEPPEALAAAAASLYASPPSARPAGPRSACCRPARVPAPRGGRDRHRRHALPGRFRACRPGAERPCRGQPAASRAAPAPRPRRPAAGPRPRRAAAREHDARHPRRRRTGALRNAAARRGLEAALVRAMADVRAATQGFPAMLALLHGAEAEVRRPGGPIPRRPLPSCAG